MKKEFIIAKAFSPKDKSQSIPIYYILENDPSFGLVEPLSKIGLGEIDIKKVAKELVAQSNKALAQSNFTVTNLLSITMHVERGMGLALYFPLSEKEMIELHNLFFKFGKYVA